MTVGNLDAAPFSSGRHTAARAGRRDRATVEQDFRALGQDWALAPEIGLLAYPR